VRINVLELVDPLQRLSTFATETVAAALRNELGAFVASVGFHVRCESGESREDQQGWAGEVAAASLTLLTSMPCKP
jgi:hypothetical protein